MSYYCSVCDKTIKLKYKNNDFESLTHEEYKKLIRINHTLQNPKFFVVRKTFFDYITNHNKNVELYLVRADFKIDFDNDLNAHIKTNFQYNISPLNLKRYFLSWFDSFCLKGYKFSHIIEMNVKAFPDKRSKGYLLY